MKTKYHWPITTILFLLIQTAYGQDGGYIATDSTISSGIELIQSTAQDNAQFISLKKYGRTIRYSPEDLKEYGFGNRKVYVSKSITISGDTKQVFLERLERGKINLYFYTEESLTTYFVEFDSTQFVELNKKEFRRQLSEYTSDYEWQEGQNKLVNYRRKSLSKFINLYNNSSNNPLAYSRFGIIAGYNYTSLTIPSGIFGVSDASASSLSLGVFGDLPIDMSNFSLNIGATFSKIGLSIRGTSSADELVINLTSLNMPILARYTFPGTGLRPFVNAGGIVAFHLENESNLHLSGNSNANNGPHHNPIISDSLGGFVYGLGIQSNLNYRKIISFELRFTDLYGKAKDPAKTHFEILTSVSF